MTTTPDPAYTIEHLVTMRRTLHDLATVAGDRTIEPERLTELLAASEGDLDAAAAFLTDVIGTLQQQRRLATRNKARAARDRLRRQRQPKNHGDALGGDE